MILADTSAWVEYDRATGSKADRRLAKLIADDEGQLAISEPIFMEVLAGARDEARENQLRRLLLRFELIRFDPVIDFDGAVGIYRRCRTAGVTPRGLVDCMIASVASRTSSTVLAHDRDIARMAPVISIDLDPASLRPTLK
ncbi:MAG: type II toxin-antitoxin system VapC family toxin [Actinomycetota bacterium]